MQDEVQEEMKRRIKELEVRVDALSEMVSGVSDGQQQHAFDGILAGINRQRRAEVNTW